MSDYTPTSKPVTGAWNTSKVLRDEFALVATAVNSKADSFGTSSVSTTSLTIDDILQTFTMEAGKRFVPGMTIYMGDSTAPATNYMLGMLVSYNSVTGLSSALITSHVGSGTMASWVIGLSNSTGATLVNNAFTGHQDFARATVASAATTADIWSALGNQINFTGTATVTGFPAALQAGASRELICAGACVFTAGANMLIDGVDSGASVTCAANDIMIVRAVTLTQFRLTRIRYDGLQQKDVGDLVTTCVTGNGRGSSLTRVRRLTTTQVNTLESTVAHSATDGTSIILPSSGLYEAYAVDYWLGAAGDKYWGIGKNITDGINTDGNPNTLTLSRFSDHGANLRPVCRSFYGAANDVIRLLSGGDYMDGVSYVTLSVRKIGNA